MNIHQKRKYAQLAFSWCKENFKPSKFTEGVPKLIIRKKGILFKGYYNQHKNIICIFLDKHNNLLDICNTVIHEWKHYQQNPEIYLKYRSKYKKSLNGHPHEISARKFAEKYSRVCKQEIEKIYRSEIIKDVY